MAASKSVPATTATYAGHDGETIASMLGGSESKHKKVAPVGNLHPITMLMVGGPWAAAPRQSRGVRFRIFEMMQNHRRLRG
jgi:hypothetical protein